MRSRARARWPWRFALREMRGGLRGFCGVHRLHRARRRGDRRRRLVRAQPRRRAGARRPRHPRRRCVVLADASARRATPSAPSSTDDGRVSVAATMRAMARTPTAQTALVEIKAVDGAYPLFGAVVLEPPASRSPRRLRERDGVFGAAVDPALLARLDLERRRAHHRRRRDASNCAPRCKSEPDKLAGGIGFGPRLLISEAALRATGLLQPGSLVRWHYRLRAARRRRQRPRRARRGRRRARSRFPTPAGKSARAPTPRPRSAATSSASRNTSRWSA